MRVLRIHAHAHTTAACDITIYLSIALHTDAAKELNERLAHNKLAVAGRVLAVHGTHKPKGGGAADGGGGGGGAPSATQSDAPATNATKVVAFSSGDGS